MSACNDTVGYYRDAQIGRRIQVIGNSCSGKSTLGEQLSLALQVPFVELDALHWRPGWVGLSETDPEEFERLMEEATIGDGWVVAGSYASFSQRTFWPRLETVIWLDLPMYQLIWRVLSRSWTRWRSKELLWGTNYDRFWPQLMVWNKRESLLWWIVSQHRRKRRNMRAYMSEPGWQHIQFLRLGSSAEVAAFSRANRLTSMQVISKAGTLPYRKRKSGEIEILAIGRQHSDHWILPMGRIEPGESPEDAGKRETQEEAGIEVQPQEIIGNLCFVASSGARHEVAYFLAEYQGDAQWPEEGLRLRRWIALDKAEQVIAPDFHVFARRARDLLQRGPK